MRHHTFITFILLSILGITSCDDVSIDDMPQQIVVEGWIEDGRFPIVVLTKTIPVSTSNTPMDNLEDYICRWARVEVDDGEHSAVLTGMVDTTYFPPYIYTTSHMRGRAGGRYTIRVDYGDMHATGITTIPTRAYIDSLIIEKGSVVDTLYTLSAMVSRQLPNRYFNFFVMRYPQDGYYLSSFLGTFTNDDLPETGARRMNINRGRKGIDIYTEYTPYFSRGDTALVKIAAMDSTAYAFWHAYERMVSLSRNPIFPYSESLPSNIDGGRGYWIGYGSTEYMVRF